MLCTTYYSAVVTRATVNLLQFNYLGRAINQFYTWI